METPLGLHGDEIAALLREARSRTLALIDGLSDEQMIGPMMSIVNPPLWEIGHVAWFHEKWAWRHLHGEPGIRADVDVLYDSAAVAHDTRWDLLLPTRAQTAEYTQRTLDNIVGRLAPGTLSADAVYFHLLGLFHEDMHDEALAYTRQTHGYQAPRFAESSGELQVGGGAYPGDVDVPGGCYLLGAFPGEEGHFAADGSFVFDNEKWAHPVDLRPFRISRAPVTQSEFAAFVDDGGYREPRFWSDAGWEWRTRARADHPVYWHADGPGRWYRRVFDQVVPIEPDQPALHVNWYEAEAYCNWAGRRLPTEAEWEMAASAEPVGSGAAASGSPWRKRRYPWGDEPPGPQRANLDGLRGGCVDVGSFPLGDSYFGCRQMLGNVWEWTADWFGPYPGFTVDPYREYSQPWFGNHKVLRGGCWATRSRLIRNTWRNFYMPDRRDVWCGFRTCALESRRP